MYVQQLEPVADSLGLSALVAALPLLIVLVLLGVVRMKAHHAGLIGLAVAALVAWLAYGMPLGQTASGAAQGALFGLFPILWIVVNALWVYRMTVRTRHFDILRRSFGRLSDDPRIQALVVAFCFGALLEALAGFGAPVAICAVMLVALGFDPVSAAVVALVANTAPVAFGAMGTPVVTLAQVTGLPLDTVASVVGRQTPLLALVVPLLLVFLVDGRRGLRETWVPALVVRSRLRRRQFAASNYVSAQLADIGAALAGAGALVAVPQRAQARRRARTRVRPDRRAQRGPGRGGPPPRGPARLRPVRADRRDLLRSPRSRRCKDWLAKATQTYDWPFLNVADPDGEPVGGNVFTLALVSTGGTLVLLAGVCTAVVLGVHARVAVREGAATVHELRFAILTVTVRTGARVRHEPLRAGRHDRPLRGGGGRGARLPVAGAGLVRRRGLRLGHLGQRAVRALQVTAARRVGALARNSWPPPTVRAACLGKMISPQNLTIACAAVGLAGREGDLLRKVLPWSLGLLLVMCLIVVGQSSPVLGLDAALTLPDVSPGSDLRLRLEVHSASARRAASPVRVVWGDR